MHEIKGAGVNQAIATFNSKYAGQLTPAGQALVSAGLFTQGQLSALGAVVPTLAATPLNSPRKNPAFRSFDANVSYPIKLKWLGKDTSITPTASFYNLFNMANFVYSTDGVLLARATSFPTTSTAWIAGPTLTPRCAPPATRAPLTKAARAQWSSR